jgi:hypothetical protein
MCKMQRREKGDFLQWKVFLVVAGNKSLELEILIILK